MVDKSGPPSTVTTLELRVNFHDRPVMSARAVHSFFAVLRRHLSILPQLNARRESLLRLRVLRKGPFSTCLEKRMSSWEFFQFLQSPTRLALIESCSAPAHSPFTLLTLEKLRSIMMCIEVGRPNRRKSENLVWN